MTKDKRFKETIKRSPKPTKIIDDFYLDEGGLFKEEYIISDLRTAVDKTGTRTLGREESALLANVNVEGFDRFEAIINGSSDRSLVPVKPYDGDFLDLYDSFEVIHGGGEGSVIKARRKSDGETVALKKYFRGGIKTADDWMNAEIAAGREKSFLERAARDRAENVPRILDFGVTGPLNEAVVAMEYVEGRTLDAVINSHGFIPDIDRVVRVAKEVAKPLKYAHENLGGFVHRDIKPANIMVDGERIIVLDWSSVRDKGLTLKNTQLYSPNYTAPEVLEGRSVTSAVDVYSLGKTLEHCLVGSLFEEREGEITREDLKTRNVPNHIVDALMKATKVNPKDRYQSVTEFVNDLEGRAEVLVANSIPHPNAFETDFQKRTLREVARNEYKQIAKFFSVVLVSGIAAAGLVLLSLYPRKNPEAKYIETENGFQIFTDGLRFDYKFKEDGNDFCLLENLVEEKKIRLSDKDCDMSADGSWVGPKIDESFYNPGAGDYGLKKFYDIHEVPKKIEGWKIRHLFEGVLAGEEVTVTDTGFTVDLTKKGLRNYGGYFVYYGGTETTPSSCRLENIGIAIGSNRRDIVDDNCDNYYDRVEIYNDLDKTTYRSGGRTQDEGLNQGYDTKIQNVSKGISAPRKIKAWKAIFKNKK